MDTENEQGLKNGGVIDITTIGARSGRDRRIEINFHHLDGRYYITGMPGRKRDWLANLVANPRFTVHLRRPAPSDVPVIARVIDDDTERSSVLYRILTESWDNPHSKARHILPRWVAAAPLIEFTPE